MLLGTSQGNNYICIRECLGGFGNLGLVLRRAGQELELWGLFSSDLWQHFCPSDCSLEKCCQRKIFLKIPKPVAIHQEWEMQSGWVLKCSYLWVEPNSFIYEPCIIQFKSASFWEGDKMFFNWIKNPETRCSSLFHLPLKKSGGFFLPHWSRPKNSE